MKKAFPIIITKRFKLRQFQESDQQNVFNGLSHPKVIPYYGISFSTYEATIEQLDWFKNLEEKEEGLWWAISSPDESVFYGAGGFNDWNHTHKKAEIGFWLMPEFWGQGIMKEVFPEIVKFGFEGMNLRRIEGFVESGNMNCKNALKKVEFQYEGTMRDSEMKNGNFISVDVYASLNPNK